jgi:NUDIX domain
MAEMYQNWNPPTVCVPLIKMCGGILVIRRALSDGYGKLSLPGGFQEMGQNWRQTLTDEVLQETGIQTNPKYWTVRAFESVENNTKNLLFAGYDPNEDHNLKYTPIEKGDETLEVKIWTLGSSDVWAFPLHEIAANDWLDLTRLNYDYTDQYKRYDIVTNYTKHD